MQISLDRFLKLTMLLAGSGALAAACTIETVDDTPAGGTNSGGQSQGGTGGSTGGSGGTANARGGAAGGGGDAGLGGAEAGSAGSPSHGGSDLGGATSKGGAGGGTAKGGAAGATADAGGGGVSNEGGSGGEAGQGGASACVSGAPADEGFDCSTLSYAEERCPDPSTEGGDRPAAAVELCVRYSEARQDSVGVLMDCLKRLNFSDMCSAPAVAAAKACETTMQARTCAATEAEDACDTISAACGEVTKAQCVAELSPLAPAKIDDILGCVSGSNSMQCGYTYRACRGVPGEILDIGSVCESIVASCPAVTTESCAQVFDYYGTGKLSEAHYYGYLDCVAISSGPCEESFMSCAE